MTSENHLIELLPGRAKKRLLGIAQEVQLAPSAVLGEAGKVIQHVYFPVGMCGAHVALAVLTVVLDREGLEAVSCSCYADERQTYARFVR